MKGVLLSRTDFYFPLSIEPNFRAIVKKLVNNFVGQAENFKEYTGKIDFKYTVFLEPKYRLGKSWLDTLQIQKLSYKRQLAIAVL